MAGKDIPVFETFDLDLAAYLMLEGLKYIECKLDKSYTVGKPRVLICFYDEKGKARDLERVFIASDFYKYRTFHKLLLKDIHRSIKGIN